MTKQKKTLTSASKPTKRNYADSEPEDLHTHRLAIDELDAQLVTLLNERLKRAAKISEIKMREGIPIKQLAREKAVLTRVVELCPIPEIKKDVKVIFTQILASSRRLQELTTKRNWLSPSPSSSSSKKSASSSRTRHHASR